MMNIVVLSLVVTSLAAAGVFSPTPETHQKHAESTIIKEGHRVVVVEYDDDGHHNTKISISPEQSHDEKFTNVGPVVLDNAKEKIKEAASVLPNMGSQGSHDSAFLHAPKDLICDAYGKCKQRIAGAMGKAKDKVSETELEAIDKKNEICDTVGKAKEAVSNKAHDVQERTKESAEKAKDVGKKIRGDIARNVSRKRVKEVKEAVEHIGSYLGSTEALHSVMNVLNLLGFATAFGLCVWITFISSYVLSRVLPRQQFGVVQCKIYPVYFRAMAYSIGMALLGHILSHRERLFLSKPETLQAYNLLASLITTLINSIYLEPRATKVMFEKMKIDKEEGRGREDITAQPSRTGEHQNTVDPIESTTTTGATTAAAPGSDHDKVRSRVMRLNDKLKRINSYSALLNVLNLMSLTWHLVYLAQLVHHCS